MFEFFFTLTAGYLAYIAYDAYHAITRVNRGEPAFKSRAVAKKSPVEPAKPAASKTTSTTETKAAVAVPVKPKKSASKAATPSSAIAEATAKLADQLRNPSTGEVSAVPANYRFAKKWIKDALVSEKLLDRVYKPNELDDVADKKIKTAMDKLRAIKKYQA